LTETGIIALVPYEESGQRTRKPGTVGVPLPTVRIKVWLLLSPRQQWQLQLFWVTCLNLKAKLWSNRLHQ